MRFEADRAFLRDLFVEPDHFHQGIGTSLFREAVHFAREHGAKNITLGGDPNAMVSTSEWECDRSE